MITVIYTDLKFCKNEVLVLSIWQVHGVEVSESVLGEKKLDLCILANNKPDLPLCDLRADPPVISYTHCDLQH